MDASLIDGWVGRRILVVGDIMLDRFVYGLADRVSPEAPTLVLRHQSEVSMLGGAGNVARNIVALGGRAVLVGAVGNDAEGELIAESLVAAEGIEGRIVRCGDIPTTVKTRYVASGQQLMRFDRERLLQPDEPMATRLADIVRAELDTIDAIVLSDYAKGVLAPAVIRKVIDLGRGRGIPIVVDPKTPDVARYAGATVLTPNAREAAAITGLATDTDAAAEAAVQAIAAHASIPAVVLTRGAQGMTIWDPEAAPQAVTIRTVAAEVYDVSGAGDTVVATLALALSAGASVTDSARIANVAAGIVVEKRGTAVAYAQELRRSLGKAEATAYSNVVGRAEAAERVAGWKARGLRVGFTNGCFDLLHPGHVDLLHKARSACDRLVVALNTDASVRRLKGESRPVQNEAARAIVMSAIGSVDLVTLFDEDTPEELIRRLRPDVLIKGADYTIATVVGASFVQSYGGEVLLIPLQKGHSTTRLIARANPEAQS